MPTIIKLFVWAYLFILACAAGASHSIIMLIVSIYASYWFLRLYPVFKDKPTTEGK